MRRLKYLHLALALALLGCTQAGPLVPVIPTPVDPAPTPVTPVDPAPQPTPEHVAPYATVQLVVLGMEKATVAQTIGFAPTLETRQDDGTTIVRWAAADPTGTARWLDVHFGTDGKVMGRSLLPRAE